MPVMMHPRHNHNARPDVAAMVVNVRTVHMSMAAMMVVPMLNLHRVRSDLGLGGRRERSCLSRRDSDADDHQRRCHC